jgi:predicted dehydrogenase
VNARAPRPVRVGLAGAGPWARTVHAPTFAAGPETELAGVWSRTRAHAADLAAEHGVPACESFDELLAVSDAVVIAVPPDVQPGLAVRAAEAGKALLLEKPLAFDVAGAEQIAAAVRRAGVGSMMLLTYRYAQVVRDFLEEAAKFGAYGGRAAFLSGAFLGGAFAGGWRLERGVLVDVGPHILDLVDAALGEITHVTGRGDPATWVSLVLQHATGAVSDVAISCRAAIRPSRTDVEIFGPGGSLSVDARSGPREQSFARLRAELADVARGARHPCDAERGLHLQRVVEAAERSLTASGVVEVTRDVS